MRTEMKSLDRATTVLLGVFALGVVLNAVQSIFGLQSSAWSTFRWVTGSLFVLALMWWIYVKIQDRRSHRASDSKKDV